MNIDWREYLAMHWPYVVALALAAISAVYLCGVEAGKRTVLTAALLSSQEAQRG